MLGMPLDTDAERMALQFLGFNGSVCAACNDGKAGSGGICGLVVHAVDKYRGLFQNSSQLRTGDQGDIVGTGSPAFEGGVVGDILVQGAAQEYIQHLGTTADAQNGLDRGKKGSQHLPLCFIPQQFRFAAFFNGSLSIASGFNVSAAGEADGPESIRAALRFGAKRLGHGVRAAEDASLITELMEKQITLECCPSSNVQTKAVASIKSHPIKSFLDKGLRVTVNTDNRTVSRTTITKEIQLVREKLGLTREEELTLYLNAADAAFISKEEREGLKNVITKII